MMGPLQFQPWRVRAARPVSYRIENPRSRGRPCRDRDPSRVRTAGTKVLEGTRSKIRN